MSANEVARAPKALLDEALGAEAQLFGRKTYVIPGGIRLGRAVMDNDLVDELRLMIYPLVLGVGERLLGETADKMPMRLVESRTLDDGLVYLVYQRVRNA